MCSLPDCCVALSNPGSSGNSRRHHHHHLSPTHNTHTHTRALANAPQRRDGRGISLQNWFWLILRAWRVPSSRSPYFSLCNDYVCVCDSLRTGWQTNTHTPPIHALHRTTAICAGISIVRTHARTHAKEKLCRAITLHNASVPAITRLDVRNPLPTPFVPSFPSRSRNSEPLLCLNKKPPERGTVRNVSGRCSAKNFLNELSARPCTPTLAVGCRWLLALQLRVAPLPASQRAVPCSSSSSACSVIIKLLRNIS